MIVTESVLRERIIEANQRCIKLLAALYKIGDMEGMKGVDDHLFTERVLVLVHDVLES